ncbi:MAG TPA: helix-turn-helix domain-containing protein [Actinocrinis sp.]|uniref:helix-turn-helix domain-containing protein n=1 Tax=Actinocrinis sp. TaxID=1920516 RepID=UPI002DDCDDBF|nr:helix-turn-helix domain-containing protein [Actinocrinis sp.]HEV2343587.1 helix-turn-helix domain-containing protein [Actinocrinis sp.]
MTSPNTTPPRGTPRIMLTAEQTAAELNIGRTTVYALIKSGELRSLLIGRLRRIPLDEIQAYTTRLTNQQHPGDPNDSEPRGGGTAAF